MFENIPQEMRAYNQFVCWRYEENEGGNPTKVPYSPLNGQPMSVNDPATWGTYEQAISALGSGWYNGIGFVLTENDPYAFIDLDEPKLPNGQPLDPEETAIRMERQRMIYNTFDSYAELSPSGKGLHIIVKGSIKSGRKRSSVEVYSNQRYMTMTGNIYGIEKPIVDYHAFINSLWEEMGKGREATAYYAGLEHATQSDEMIVDIASRAVNAEKFYDLYNVGNWQKYYPSQSEADISLINIIAYYTQNRAQIKRIFLNSALGQRPKSRANYRIGYALNKAFDRMLPPIDTESLRNQLNEILEKKKAEVTKPAIALAENYMGLPAPAELMPTDNEVYSCPPGLLGEIAQYIYAQSPLPVKEISIAGAIGLMAGIVGKAYNISGTGCNQYVILLSLTGCHAKGTEILMYNGSIKNVEDVIVGDLLMGPDSKPRTVLSLARGRETMVRVTPTKGRSFVVNENHIFSLKHTTTKKRTLVTAKDWFNQSVGFRHCNKLERVSVEFDNKVMLPIDPWFLGAMLGDGHFVGTPCLTGMDEAIHDRALSAAMWFDIKPSRQQVEGNKAWQIRFSKKNTSGNADNKLTNALRKLNLWGCTAGDKFIPNIYKTSSRKNRLSILAGLIDTDGSLSCNGYDFISKSQRLSEDVIFIARSLGFAAYYDECEKYSQNGTGGKYYRVSISGDTTELPLSLEYKKAKPRLQKKDVLVTGVKMQKIEVDDFYGFALDGDHLYLTGDFTIHHNTGKEAMASGIAKLMTEVKKTIPKAGDFIGPGAISSEQALIKYMYNTSSSFVSIFGEFAITLQQLSSDKAPPHQIGVRRMLLDLYNKSGAGNEVQPTIYSDKEKNTNIVQSPAFSMLAESSPEIFYSVLNEEMVTGGLLPRMLVIENLGELTKPNDGAKLVVPSKELLQKMATICGNSLNLIHQKKVLEVDSDDEAKKILSDFREYARNNIIGSKEIRRQLWNRAHIKALKLAALVAIGVAPFNPLIDREAALWAINIVMNDIRNLSKRFDAGEVGIDNEETRQLSRAVDVVKDFVTRPHSELVTYGVSQLMHSERIIPYGYLQKRLSQTAPYRKDKMGATNALKRNINTLKERGDLVEVPIAKRAQYSTTANCYMIANLKAFGL